MFLLLFIHKLFQFISKLFIICLIVIYIFETLILIWTFLFMVLSWMSFNVIFYKASIFEKNKIKLLSLQNGSVYIDPIYKFILVLRNLMFSLNSFFASVKQTKHWIQFSHLFLIKFFLRFCFTFLIKVIFFSILFKFLVFLFIYFFNFRISIRWVFDWVLTLGYSVLKFLLFLLIFYHSFTLLFLYYIIGVTFI